MAFKLADRTREIITTTGAIASGSTINLGGTTNSDLKTFVAAVADTNQTIACIVSGNNVDWIEFLCTVHAGSPDNLHVDSIIKNNSGTTSGITLAAGSRGFSVIPGNWDTLFDNLFGNGIGSILRRDAGGHWLALAPGGAGTRLQANGTGSDLTWTAPTVTSAMLDTLFGTTRGSIIFRNATAWVALGPGTSGQFLKTFGAGADAAWATVAAGASTLATLTDVNFGTLSDKQHMRYDNASSKWVNVSDGAFSSIDVKSENLSIGTPTVITNYASTQSAVTSFPILELRQSRGTEASKSAVQSGDTLGGVAYYGWNGSAFALTGAIQIRATENWTGSAQGSEVYFSTTPIGTTTPQSARLVPKHYTVGFSAPQTTVYSASQIIGHHKMAAAVTLPANMGAYEGRVSQSGGTANATASTVFSVEKAVAASPNTFSQIGTITIAAGTTAATLATASGAAQSFAQGDVMRIVAPASADGTFAGFYATLAMHE